MKVGTFMTGTKLEINSISLKEKEYKIKLRKSIMNCITWLENNNILNDEVKGKKVLNILAKGITFSDETNQYLIDTCLYWKDSVEKELRNNYNKNIKKIKAKNVKDTQEENKNMFIGSLVIDTSMTDEEDNNSDGEMEQYWLEYLMMLKEQNPTIDKSQGYFVHVGVDEYELWYAVVHNGHADYLPETIINQYLT